MLNKLIFVILILLFGALTYLMGIYTPIAQQLTIQSTVHSLIGSKTAASAAGTAGQAATDTKDNAKAAADASSAPKPVALSALTVSSPAAKGTQFGLKILALPPGADTSSLTKKLEKAGLAGVNVNAVDASGNPWLIYAAGPFDSEAAATTAMPEVVQALDLSGELPVITLPKPQKPAS